MCDCISKLKNTIIEKIKTDKYGIGIIERGDFKNYGISFGKKSFIRTYNEFEYIMTNIKKDGSTGATKKHSVSIYHIFCPFCGEKHPE